MGGGAARISGRIALRMRPAQSGAINAASTNDIEIYVTHQPWFAARDGSVNQVAGGH